MTSRMRLPGDPVAFEEQSVPGLVHPPVQRPALPATSIFTIFDERHAA
jgi:hypothetical protein